MRRDGIYFLVEFTVHSRDETRDDLSTREYQLDREIGFRLWESFHHGEWV